VPEWIQIILRSLGALAALFLMTRFLGKKQISQLSFFQYILGITLGELAGFISTDMEAHYAYGLLALFVWFIVPFVLDLLTMKSRTLRKWFEGKGRVLVKEGKVLEDNLKKEHLTADELLEQMRAKNVFNLADVEFAVMETNGDLSILLKKDKQPLTASHLGQKTVNEVEPQTVIIDGIILDEPLATAGLNRGWLKAELDKIGVAPENVFLAQVDAYQQLYVDLYDDNIKTPAPQGKALLYANLKKIQADLELFALATRDPGAKAMYGAQAEKLERIIGDLRPMLQS